MKKMGFNSDYRRQLDRTNGTTKYGSKKSLLEFFGFTYQTWESPYTQSVWINDDSYIGGKRKVSNTEYDKYEGYERKHSPSGKEAELEDRFVKLQSSSFDPLASKYLPVSVKDYYDGLSFPGEFEAGIGCGVGIVLTVLWIVLHHFTHPFLKNWLGTVMLNGVNMLDAIWLFVVPIVICLITTLIGGVVQGIRRAKNGKRTKYQDLSNEMRKALRDEYLKSLSSAFPGEAGEILKEYAILKGYDRI